MKVLPILVFLAVYSPSIVECTERVATNAGSTQLSYATPSELNTHARAYDQKVVQIKGWANFDNNVGQIWDSKEAYDSGDLTGCTTLLGVDTPTAIQLNNRWVAISGTFYRDAFEGIINPDICNQTGLKIARPPNTGANSVQ
jgi:hypothetical protein